MSKIEITSNPDPVATVDKIQIQTTSACNGRCVICPYMDSWMTKNPGKMEKYIFDKVLTDLEPFKNLKTLCTYYMNDSLCDQRIWMFIDQIAEKYPDKVIEVSTNPFNLYKKNREKIIEHLKDRKHDFWISFHGINEGTMEHIMGLPFKPCMDNVLAFLKESEGRIKTLIRGAGMSLDNRNVFFAEGHYLAIWNDYLLDAGLNPRDYDIQFFKFHDRAGNLIRQERDCYKLNFGFRRLIDPAHPFYCVRFDKVFHVLWNGDVSICCMDYFKEFDLGSIKDQTIEQYYSSDKFKALWRVGTGQAISDPDFICKRCPSPGG